MVADKGDQIILHSSTLPRKSHSVSETFRPRRSRSRSSSENTNHDSSQLRLKRHASQATMWYTTVPQSIRSHSLGSRHAPTRRSLRHSRMIVLSKARVSGKDHPPLMNRFKLVSCLAVVHFLTGFILVGFLVVMFLWAPHLAMSDLSNYAGLPQCISAWLVIIFILCLRFHSRRGSKWECCSFSAEPWHWVSTTLLMIFSSLCASAAFMVQTAHLYYLFVAIPRCNESTFPRAETGRLAWGGAGANWTLSEAVKCVCQYDTTRMEQSLAYPGLGCADVKSVLPFFLTTSSVINFIGLFAGFWYVGLVMAHSSQTLTAAQHRSGLKHNLIPFTSQPS